MPTLRIPRLSEHHRFRVSGSGPDSAFARLVLGAGRYLAGEPNRRRTRHRRTEDSVGAAGHKSGSFCNEGGLRPGVRERL